MKILSYRKNEKEGALLGYFSLEYSDMYGMRFINSCKLFRNKNTGSWFITMPDREYEQDGVKKYNAHTGYTTREANDLFQSNVIKSLQEFFDAKAKSDQNCQVQYPHVNAHVQQDQVNECPF